MKPKKKVKGKAKKMVGRRIVGTGPTPKADIIKGMGKYGM